MAIKTLVKLHSHVPKVHFARLNWKFDRCPKYVIIAFVLSISPSIVNIRSTAGDTSLTKKHHQQFWHKSRPSTGMNTCRHTKWRKMLVEIHYHGLSINTGIRKSEWETKRLVDNCEQVASLHAWKTSESPHYSVLVWNQKNCHKLLKTVRCF